MNIKFVLIFLILAVFTGSCTSRSLEDFREEGEGIIKSLIQDLRAIHTRDELLASSSRIQHHLDHLVSIMIAAREFNKAHPDLEKPLFHNHELSDQLRVELNRIYRLEGGRSIIEKIQERALNRLDAFEKKEIN